MARARFVPKPTQDPGTARFANAEEAWFWCVQAAEAKAQGARIAAGQAETPRPCEPLDILAAVDRLYRQRRLIRDHLCVLRHYGQRLTPPDPRRKREQRASTLWREAFDHLTPVLQTKGIVE